MAILEILDKMLVDVMSPIIILNYSITETYFGQDNYFWDLKLTSDFRFENKDSFSDESMFI